MARLALLLPAIASVAIVWVGSSGAPPNRATADVPVPTAAASFRAPETPYPERVLGLVVHELGDVVSKGPSRDEVFAVAGWYVATALTDCPAVAIVYRDGALPEIRPDADRLAYCDRSGVLYGARPDADLRENSGLSAISVTVALGVLVPSELELPGADAREVVVLGHFVESTDGCALSAGCSRELVVDHLAWTPGA